MNENSSNCRITNKQPNTTKNKDSLIFRHIDNNKISGFWQTEKQKNTINSNFSGNYLGEEFNNDFDKNEDMFKEPVNNSLKNFNMNLLSHNEEYFYILNYFIY